jgi:hypothetical protein
VPGAFRATLPYDGLTGAVLAGADGQSPVNVRAIQHERIASRVMALNAPAWFDAVSAGARACAALAKPDARSNIGW